MAASTLVAAIALGTPAAQSPVRSTRDGTLDRVTRYVEQYYNRAQSLMAEETVTLQHLRPDLAPDGRIRRLVYELRVEWTPAADGGEARASVVRQLLRVGSRPARPSDKPECLDPRATSRRSRWRSCCASSATSSRSTRGRAAGSAAVRR